MHSMRVNASITPLLTLMLVHMWYEESTPQETTHQTTFLMRVRNNIH